MSKTAVAVAASLVLLAPLALIAMSGGCTTHACDASLETLGRDAGPDGSLGVGFWDLQCFTNNSCALTWRTSSFVGEQNGNSVWLPFDGQKTYTYVFPPLPSLPPGASLNFTNAYPLPYIAFAPLNDFGDGNIALAPGSNVEITGYEQSTLDGGPEGGPTRGSLTVFNPTCAAYSIQVTLAGIEVDFDAGTEAGPDGDEVGLDGGQIGPVTALQMSTGVDATVDQ
jgi:hypothetical protein